MTQQPFSRPGAVDLSGLQAPGAGAPAPTAGTIGSYAVEVDRDNFQAVLESSMQAPVIVTFYSPTQSPASQQLADDVAAVANSLDGRILAGSVNIDEQGEIAQAMQIPGVPLAVLVVQGRPMPLFQDPMSQEELRAGLTQVLQQLATQGMTGRHQPRAIGGGDEDSEPDPRYAPAQEALANNDYEGAVAAYQALVDANPADAEAAAGLAMAEILLRTKDADLQQARTAAAEAPDDVDAQTLVADLDLLGGHVEDAFTRLVEFVRRSSGEDRDRARLHLIGLFNAVGNEDARVIRGRQNLASALF